MKKFVVGFLFSENRKNVALICKLRPAWQKGLYNGIGGKVKNGEELAVAMVREFREETGVKTELNIWRKYVHIIRKNKYNLYVFSAFSDQLFAVKSAEKEVVEIFSVSNLPQKIVSNLKWLIPLALDENINVIEPIIVKESFK